MDINQITELVGRAKGGDQSAIAELYEATKRAVYFTALKIVGDPTDAEDIAQDTYLTAISKLSELKEDATFPKWVKTIAVNTSKNFMLKKKPMLFGTDEEEQAAFNSTPEVAEDFLPDSAADKKETCRLVSEMIDRLPEKQRAVVIMFYFDEMTISEIAKALDTNDNTVKSRLNYARKQIKDEVEALEKKGTKLYCVAGVPVLAFVLKGIAENTAVPAGIAAKAGIGTAAATTTAAATAATTATTAANTAAATTTAAAATGATGATAATAATAEAASAAATAATTAAAAANAAAATAGTMGIGAKIAIIASIAASVAVVGVGAAVVVPMINEKPVETQATEAAIVYEMPEETTAESTESEVTAEEVVATEEAAVPVSPASDFEYVPYYSVYEFDENDCSKYTVTTKTDGCAITGYKGRDDDVIIPSEIDGLPVKEIGNYAFSSSHKINSVQIPDTVTSIGRSAFRSQYLSSITIPDSVTFIGESAFVCCPLKTVDIGSGVKYIEYGGFSNCFELTELTVPGNIEYIGRSVFSRCTALKELNIENGVKRIGVYAFFDCTELRYVSIPEGVESIYGGAFQRCRKLKSVIIPESVTYIGDYAFGNCESLETVIIPGGYLDYHAFVSCLKLKNVAFGDKITEIHSAGSIFGNLSSLNVTGDLNEYTVKWLDNLKIPYKQTGPIDMEKARAEEKARYEEEIRAAEEAAKTEEKPKETSVPEEKP